LCSWSVPSSLAVVSKLLWFRDAIDEDKVCYTVKEMIDLIDVHLHRLDEELEAIQTLHQLPGRHGRQYSSREDSIKATIERERQLFTGPGFEAPDILESSKFELFKSWKGDEKLLPKIALRKYIYKAD
jgi:hypothetical protein